MKKKLSKEVKQRLGVLQVLLNVSTEYNGDSAKIVEVMDMIEKAYPSAKKMWDDGNFQILVDGKVIYEWGEN